MSFSYGNNIRLNISGGSHDPAVTAELRGLPAGIAVDTEKLHRFMLRRAPGRSSAASARREDDILHILSGITGGVTDGGPIKIRIDNTDARPGDYLKCNFNDTPRPSHADYPATVRYGGNVDLRGGGHFSGRLTAPLCAAGGICLQMLAARGITVTAHIYSIGDIRDTPFDTVNVGADEYSILSEREFPVLDVSAGERMSALISRVRSGSDSIGGVIECALTGLEAGLGEHMFAGIEARISSAMFAVPAVKGVEFGSGFSGCASRGSENNDPYVTDGLSVRTETNNAGGILGGMSTGMPVVFRVAVKPTPSIGKPQRTVSLSRMENTEITVSGRHDPCIVPRAVAVIEAAAALAAVDLLLDSAPGDTPLAAYRNDIDRADSDIADAFRRRMDAVAGIAAVKHRGRAPVYVPEREKAVLERVSRIAGDEYADDCRLLYGEMLRISRDRQNALMHPPYITGFADRHLYLIGEKLAHSMSPELHSLYADYGYGLRPMPPEKLPGFLAARDFDALNVTVPYKKAVIPCLDRLSADARRCGAVNTVLKLADGRLYGDNTDIYGFSYLLKRSGINVAGKHVLLAGSGGAAAAVYDVLTRRGAAKIHVLSRGGAHGTDYADVPRLIGEGATVLVNATPSGMYPDCDGCPLDPEDIAKLRDGVIDLVYNPVRTTLLCHAENAGIPAVGGLSMLAAQAARTCRLVTGITVPAAEINAAARLLEAKMRNIVLIGMPGCGKTTVGRRLAGLLGRTFVDTDAEIYAATGRTPARILTESGECALRDAEHTACVRASRTPFAVIATGGGAVTRSDNYLPLRRGSVVVWLTRDPDTLPLEGRPISAAEDIRTLYARREPLYRRFSDISIAVDPDADVTAAKIIRMIR